MYIKSPLNYIGGKYKILKESQFYYEKEYNHLNKVGMFFLKVFYYISLGIAYLTFWM